MLPVPEGTQFLFRLNFVLHDTSSNPPNMQAIEGHTMSQPVKTWQDISGLKKAEQAARIPAEWRLKPSEYPLAGTIDVRPVASSCGILSDRELKITGDSYDATSLAGAIANSTYTAEEVAIAFCKRAAIGHQLCNNLTEIMFLDAIEDAKNLDMCFKETGKTVGPLHGLPMTFKVRPITSGTLIIMLTFV